MCSDKFCHLRRSTNMILSFLLWMKNSGGRGVGVVKGSCVLPCVLTLAWPRAYNSRFLQYRQKLLCMLHYVNEFAKLSILQNNG